MLPRAGQGSRARRPWVTRVTRDRLADLEQVPSCLSLPFPFCRTQGVSRAPGSLGPHYGYRLLLWPELLYFHVVLPPRALWEDCWWEWGGSSALLPSLPASRCIRPPGVRHPPPAMGAPPSRSGRGSLGTMDPAFPWLCVLQPFTAALGAPAASFAGGRGAQERPPSLCRQSSEAARPALEEPHSREGS